VTRPRHRTLILPLLLLGGIASVVFFGFYLFGCDQAFNQFFKFLEKTINKR